MKNNKTLPLPRQTPVVLFGLAHNTALNGKQGEVAETFDGSRYGIKMANGSCVRVSPDKLSPVHALAFVQHVQRLMNELCVFAHRNYNGASDIFNIKSTALGPDQKVLSPKLQRVELRFDRTLVFYYAESSQPCMQLQPLPTMPSGSTTRIAVFDFDTPTALNDVDFDADSIMLSCRGSTFFFENWIPMYHMSLSHMLSYMTERMTACVVDNYFDVLRYLQNVDNIEDQTYDPHSRCVLYKLISSDARGKIICPSKTVEEFAVARHGHMTEYRFMSLAKASVSSPPSHAVYVFPIGTRVKRNSETLTIGDEPLEDVTGLMPSVETFLETQFVLCTHFVKYGMISGMRTSSNMSQHTDGIIALICDMIIAHSDKKSARLAQYIMTSNNSDGTHFLLSPHFMDSIYKNVDKLKAWIANLEALLNAFAIALEGAEHTFAIEDGLFKVTTNDGLVVYVGSFANDPIENQAWIFQRELHNISDGKQTLSIQNTIGRLASTSNDMNAKTNEAIQKVLTSMCKVSAAHSSATCTTPVKRTTGAKKEGAPLVYDDALLEERLKMQSDLIAAEEKEKQKQTTAATNKRKKRKKRKAVATAFVEETRALSAKDSSTDASLPSELAKDLHPPLFARDTVPDESILVSSAAKEPTPVVLVDGDTVSNVSESGSSKEQSNICAPSPPQSTTSDATTSTSDSSDVPETEFVPVVNSRTRAVANLKQRLIVASDHIMTLELSTASQLADHKIEIQRQAEAHAREMQNIRTLMSERVETLASQNRKLESQHQELDAQHQELKVQHQELEARHRELELQHRELVTQNHRLLCNATDHANEILTKIADQLRHYLSGHYMKLDHATLSIPAVLRDGHMVVMLIHLYRRFVEHEEPEHVIALAVNTTDTLKLIGGGITFATSS